MKIYYLICIFLCASFSIDAQENADNLFANGQYLDAAVHFEFEVFKSKDIKNRNSLLFKKYLCYKHMAEYDKAISTILRLKYLREDSIKSRIGYEKALLYYLQGEYNKSHLELKKLIGNPYNDEKALYILETLVSVDQLEWGEARKLLQDETAFTFSESEIEKILPPKLKPKDPNKAENLSLIPGLGQWYAGYFWKGATSGLIQAGIGGFMLYSLLEGYIFSGTLTGAAGLYTFNLGGSRHAGELAVRKNKELTSGVKQRFLEQIQEEE